MLAFLGITVMLVSLLLIPLGLPGLWVMIGVLAVAALQDEVSLTTLVALTAAATVAELLEFVVVRRFSLRYGGSRRAFWGAIAGGIAGVFVGLPIPLIGSVVAGVVGSFVGAAAVTLWETRHLPSATRVGWGVMLGRAAAIALKSAAGVVILVLGAAALIYG